MPTNLTIVFGKKTGFQWNRLDPWLAQRGFSKNGTPDKIIYKNPSISITIKDYPTNVTLQGKLSDDSREVLVFMQNMDTLVLRGKELKKYLEILKPDNGKVICAQCGKASSFIKSDVRASQNISFIAECGHVISTNAPLLISRNRILPDLNRLISRTTSKMIRMGFFNGFEFVIPEYYDRYVDAFFKPTGSKRTAYLEELGELKVLESQGRIRLYRFPFSGTLKKKDHKSEEQIEDDVIIGFGQKTQSIILSSDRTVIQKLATLGLDGILIEGKFDQTVKVNSAK